MIATTEQDLIEEAEEIARQAAEEAEIAAEEAEAAQAIADYRMAIDLIKALKLKTLADIRTEMAGTEIGDLVLADYEDGHAGQDYPASELILDIKANYLF